MKSIIALIVAGLFAGCSQGSSSSGEKSAEKRNDLASTYEVSSSATSSQTLATVSPICYSIPECQTIIEKAQAQLQELLTGGDNQKISTIGTVFKRDRSNPALGEAYKDPSGLVWGSFKMNDNTAKTKLEAISFCRKKGARLPRSEEFDQLTKYLGKGSPGGYNPMTAPGPGSTVLFTGLTNGFFWGVQGRGPDEVYMNEIFFAGAGGFIETSNRNFYNWVVCVAGRGPSN